MQATSFPDERFGDPGFQYLCVVITGFFEILDQYIDVAELQIHGMPPSELMSMVTTAPSELDGVMKSHPSDAIHPWMRHGRPVRKSVCFFAVVACRNASF